MTESKATEATDPSVCTQLLNAEDERKAFENTCERQSRPFPGRIGLCSSGGGSRSLSATMGQLRALRHLGLLEKTRHISAVSGGAWATTLFTFLPASVSDDDFLGGIATPEDLWWRTGNHGNEPANLNYLARSSLGRVPQRLHIPEVILQMIELETKYDRPLTELWVDFVGRTVFEPYGLHAVGEDRSDPSTYGKPTRFFSQDRSYVESQLLPNNPNLETDDFYTVERPRPFLIINASIFRNEERDSEIYPLELSAVGAGVRPEFRGHGRNGQDIGGGLIQPMSFGSFGQKLDKSGRVHAQIDRRFTLADIAALSGAGFAEPIIAEHPRFRDLVPRFSYWPVLDCGDPRNQAQPHLFGDGGNLENTGIMALLSRKMETIIVFVNCEHDIVERSNGAGGTTLAVDSQLPPLFGYIPIDKRPAYVKYGEEKVGPEEEAFAENQVFPYEAFEDLLDGLWRAKSRGGPVLHLQRDLKVLTNPKFDIAGGTTANVLWVYNSRTENWWKRLSPRLLKKLAAEHHHFGKFPNYHSIPMALSRPQVNLLAHMACWNVMQDDEEADEGMTSAELVRSLYGK